MIARTLVLLGLWLLRGGTAQALEPLPPGATVALLRAPEAARDAAFEAALADATRALGYRVVAAERTALDVAGDRATLCKSSHDCRLSALRAELDVDALALFVMLKGGGAPQLLVRVARKDGENEATHELRVAGQDEVLRRLMGHALGGRREIKLTTVLITSVPPRALVSLDRKPVQEAPARFVVLPGKHTLRGRLRGYAPVVEEIDVPAQGNPFDYQLTLPQQLLPSDETYAAGEPQQATPAPTVRQQASVWNYVIAGGLGLTAVGLGTYAIVQAARDGDCARRSSVIGTCIESYDNGNAILGGSIGAGAALLASAAFLMWTPITVAVDPQQAAVVCDFRGHF